MGHIERSVRAAQRRMFANVLLARLTWTLTTVAGMFAAIVLFVRLYDWPVPLGWVALGMAGLGLVSATAWALVGRPGAVVAAAALDAAAGLRERISSGLLCQAEADPFARAVVNDAERISSSITVGKHLRLRVPPALAYSGIAALLAGLMFLVPVGALRAKAVVDAEQSNAAFERTKAVVQKPLEAVRQLAEKSPSLSDLKDNLEQIEKMPGKPTEKPDIIRHEAVKKIDQLESALHQKREESRFNENEAFKKMLRGLQAPQNTDSPTGELQKSLAKGDFKAAQEEIKALKEQLATLQKEQDPEQIKKLQNDLEQLAKQLEQVAENKQLAEKLEQAGVKKEDVERMLKSLTKQDLEQVKKQLEQQGMSQKQLEQLAKQLQQQVSAGSQAQQMSQAMKQAASAAGQGQMGEAMSQLQSAGDQLSQSEQLEQEKNQLDSAMADLQNAKNDLNNSCSQCNGTGQKDGGPCKGCGGSGMQPGNKGGGGKGNGMGNLGQGAGGLAAEEKTDVAFKVERAKVHTGKGKIIGQFLVDGEQVKGSVSKEMAEVVAASERDATDAVKREKIPRQYQKVVKASMSAVRKTLDPKAPDPESTNDEDGAKAAEKKSGGEKDGKTAEKKPKE